jgi:DNA invertase Pin-like site-specific DNA recombinase
MEVELVAKHVAEIITAPESRVIPRPLQLEAQEKVRDLMSMPARPGRGGRQPSVPAGVETQATAELREKLGPPKTKHLRGAELQMWEVDAEGEGAIAARLSTRDVQKGETVMTQIHGSLELCAEEGMKPRYIIVATKQNGSAATSGRLDLMFLMEVVRRGEIKWVMYREVDRLARDVTVGNDFYKFLESHGVDLYMTQQRQKVDWDSDKFFLQILGSAADHEKRTTGRRIMDAHRRRRLEPGRGWPGAVKFGFRTAKDGYLEVDPVQWSFVEHIHFDYTALGEKGRGSLRRLKDHMDGLGCPFSVESLRRILRDPIYVTGEWSSTVLGIEYPCRRIDIPKPIPASVQEKNISLLENTRGLYSATPYGTYLLNNIPVLHSRCMDLEVKRNLPDNKSDMTTPVLRGRNYGKDRRRHGTYTHVPRTPECCRRYSIQADMLESAVIGALLDLAESEELQLAYLDAAAATQGFDDVSEDLAALRRKVSSLKLSHAKLLREFTEDVALTGHTSGASSTARLADALETEIETCQNRIKLVEATKTSKPREKSKDLREALEKVLVFGENPTNDRRQKRVALIGALVSKVIVHDNEEGIEIEVFGHLIPAGRKLVPLELVDHFENVVSDVHTVSTKPMLSRQRVIERTIFGEAVPAWQSSRKRLDTIPFGIVSVDAARSAIKWAADHSRPGRLFNKWGHEKSPYNEAREKWPQLMQPQAITNVLFNTAFDRNGFIRDALGVEKALRQGRVAPRGEHEIRMVIKWALEDGFTLYPGWNYRWDSFAREKPYLWCHNTMANEARRLGYGFSQLAYIVSDELGLGYERELNGTLLLKAPVVTEELATALNECVTTKDLVRHPGWYAAKLTKMRSNGELIGFRLHGRPKTYYPRWQFDGEWRPLPIVAEIVRLVQERSLSLWDVHAEMLRTVRYKRQKRALADLCTDKEGSKWLLAHLESRFRHARRDSRT